METLYRLIRQIYDIYIPSPLLGPGVISIYDAPIKQSALINLRK